jgi:DNA repair exonuclease SbcCD ATPase subunit
MKIISLYAENVKRLKAVEIRPDGNAIILEGKNAQGKSSVLDAIWWALGGVAAQKGSDKPIREGQARAKVDLDLGDIHVTRTWTANDRSTLKVENADGTTVKSPQALLDGLVGRLSFDPLAFSRMAAKEQRETLIDLAGIREELQGIERVRQTAYDSRTETGREIKRLEGYLEKVQGCDPNAPDEQVSPETIMAELREAQQVIGLNRTKRDTLDQLRAKAKRIQDRIASLKAEIEKEESELGSVCEVGKDLSLEVESLVDPDLDAITEKLNDLQAINAAVQAKRERNDTEAALLAAGNERDRLTEEIGNADKAKEELLQNAPLPVPGLSINDNGVTFRGVPFAQCSGAEQLKISLAMAMRLNPTLRVIRITDGSLLDEESLKQVAAMAEAEDYQVWVERVADEPSGAAVYIEDGEVRA